MEKLPSAPALIGERSTTLTDARDARLTHWRARLIVATARDGDFPVIFNACAAHGNILAVLQTRSPINPLPRLGPKGRIGPVPPGKNRMQADIYADVYTLDDQVVRDTYLGVELGQWLAVFTHFGTRADFTQAEADELQKEMRAWLCKDDRVAEEQRAALGDYADPPVGQA